MLNVDINVDRRTDRRTYVRTENRTPISHPATSRCDKNQIFSLFLIVKMNANYAEICRVGNLEADLEQVPFVQFF